MAVLVTGGAGYIGSHMVLSLLEAGRRVVVLDNLSTGFREALSPEAAFVEGDVGDASLIARTLAEFNVDAVVHFAGSVVVAESVARPLDYYLNNTVKTRTLIEACLDGGVRRFIFSSTAAVYGAPTRMPICEEAASQPISPYGASKAMSERMLIDAAAASGATYAIMRYFNVAGADPAGRAGQRARSATHLIKIGIEAAVGKRKDVTVFGADYPTPDGTTIRDYIHVSDLVEAHRRALLHLEAGGDSLTLNCGCGRGYSVREVLSAIEEEAGVRLVQCDGPPRPGDPPEMIADCRRIGEALGWTPQYDNLRFMIRTAMDFENAIRRDG